jgi:N-acyl-L-homoserine lactone synthetase
LVVDKWLIQRIISDNAFRGSQMMPLLCLDWRTIHLHGEAWISHHRLRYRIFVQRQGWDLPTHGDLEYDQFDTPAAKYLLWVNEDGVALGCARLIPTSEPYMIKKLWPDLVTGGPPHSDQIWEASRFGCDHTVPTALRRQIVAELICGCQAIGLAYNVRSYLGVMPLAILRTVIGSAGCRYELVGPVRRVGHRSVAAAQIDISEEILNFVRRRHGIRKLQLCVGEPTSPEPALARAAPVRVVETRRRRRSATCLHA